jgi:hypothetical protein
VRSGSDTVRAAVPVVVSDDPRFACASALNRMMPDVPDAVSMFYASKTLKATPVWASEPEYVTEMAAAAAPTPTV